MKKEDSLKNDIQLTKGNRSMTKQTGTVDGNSRSATITPMQTSWKKRCCMDYEGIRRSIYEGERCEVYYCHSYASWEKGTVERNNRIIRRFFPKGTDFTKITKKQVAAVQDWMNNYPRKILNWKSPAEISA